ncbi:tetratricopeptide repeat-containing sensor histidine kinase [Flavobacterium aquidurense]|uniref:histidine kinase n=1 Tax=Flavobacterium aquidurense TaxID=362413 RepID=A0A0N8VNS7_9FLAO|nr:tetratricopeptide repeat-containing sensor histidine kinase [Flavobacterium aquidurense]KQB42956.1 putative signal transduction histidine kinase [Flavobacterium aquidurense]
MIPNRLQIYLYIIFAIFILLSCQKNNDDIIIIPNNKTEVKKLIIVADRFYNNKNFDSAFYYYNKVKFICNPITDSENFVSTVNRMAEIQQNQGDYTGSESTVTEAIPYLKYIKNPEYAWNTYITLSINFLNTYDYKKAILYNQKAFELKSKPWQKLAAENNIAIILIEEEKYHESLEIFLRLLSKKEVTSDDEFHSKVLDNTGFCYFKINDSENAIRYFNKGLEIRQKGKKTFDLGKSYFHFAKYYEKRNPSLAKKYMLSSYTQFTISNSVDERMESLKLLITNSSDRELKKYSVIYVNLVDSIFEVRQKAKNQFAKIKYDSKKDRDENLKLKTHKVENQLQIEKQKNRNIISYIIIIFTLSLILVLYFYLTSRGNKEKIEATYNSETRIAKKLHDELANDIYHTMAFAENKNLSLVENREHLINNLDAIYSRTRDISKENNPIITSEKYIFYLEEMIAGFNTPHLYLLVNNIDTISWDKIDKNKKITVYRVLQELLVNMKKHSDATLVSITFKATYKSIIVNYTDNGKGIDLNNITFRNGLHNAENRILAIKGKIDIHTAPKKGFKVFFEFPL